MQSHVWSLDAVHRSSARRGKKHVNLNLIMSRVKLPLLAVNQQPASLGTRECQAHIQSSPRRRRTGCKGQQQQTHGQARIRHVEAGNKHVRSAGRRCGCPPRQTTEDRGGRCTWLKRGSGERTHCKSQRWAGWGRRRCGARRRPGDGEGEGHEVMADGQGGYRQGVRDYPGSFLLATVW